MLDEEEDGGEKQPKKKLRRTIRLLDREEKKKHKRLLHSTVGKNGMWPLNAPGMSPPGPDFLRVAHNLGDTTDFVKGTAKKEAVYKPGGTLTDMYRRALREPGFTLEVQTRPGKFDTVTFVPGHIWGQHADQWAKSLVDSKVEKPKVDGPHPADVMVIGKMPWKDEVKEGRNLIGATGEVMVDIIAKLHIKNANSWYITNLCKFMPPDESRELKAGWIHDCRPLLDMELRIVRPRYILCLGAEASKWVLGDKFNVSYMAGRVVPYSFDCRLSSEDEPDTHTAHVMTVIHPVMVAKDPAQARILESNMGRFANLLETHNLDLEEKNLDHRTCRTLEEAQEWIEEASYELMQLPEKARLVAWDLEWEGQHPMNKGTYVRTIQCSWGDKKAITFVISEAGGKKAFKDHEGKGAVKRLVWALNKFQKDCKTRTVGHFLVSDMEWAEHLGLKLIDHCPVPLKDGKKLKAWERLRHGEGWLDTAMMNHAIEETAPLGLEMLTMRYTMAPRYDIPLEDWKTEYTRQKKLKKEAVEGYGECPDDVLIPYANYDADVTRRIAVALLPLLDADYEGNCAWEPFWESMMIQKAILRIHQNGIVVDRNRIDDLTLKFITWRAKKEEEIREWACWKEDKDHPAFNIRSVQHVREFLFGENLNGKRTPDGKPIRIRPKDAKSLYIQPLLDTSKPPRRWKDLVEKGLHRDASPGTGKMVLGILAQENLNKADQINMIRDYRFLDQVLKSVLRVPKTEDDDPEKGYIENDEGFLEYDAGLAYSIDDDGRVRTHLYPTAETGRWKSSRPNLQNISKSRDPDYVRLLGGTKNEKGQWVGGDYTCSLRSVLKASDGYALVEADYKGAELYGMALMSGSKKMQDHCLRSLLPDEGYDEQGNKVEGGKFPHPNYYDIHSNVAVLAFQLKCHPSKNGLKEIGKVHFRTLAKNVIFGIAYGRQAKAIALQAKEQGINVSVHEAQLVIDAIFKMYPELLPFFEEAKSRAKKEKWLCNAFGRLRRFPTTSDYKLEGEFERQAMNFPIQSMIASCVDRGIAYLVDKIEELGLQNEIRILLQIHDAILLEAKYEYVEFAQQLIQWAFVDMVEIYPTNLAGEPLGDGPYRLGLDFEVSKHWGEKFEYEEAVKVGLDPKFAKKPKPKPAPVTTEMSGKKKK